MLCFFFRYFDSSSPRFCRLSEAPTLLASVRSLSRHVHNFSRFVVVVGGKIVVDVDSSRSLLLVYSAVTSPKLRSLSHVELSSVGGGESWREARRRPTQRVYASIGWWKCCRTTRSLAAVSFALSCLFFGCEFSSYRTNIESFSFTAEKKRKKKIHIFWLCALLLHFSWRFVVQRVRRTENSLSKRRFRVSEKEKSNREYLKREIIQEKKTKSPGKINSRKNSIFSWTPSRRHTLTAF